MLALHGNPPATVICCYSLKNTPSEVEIKNFFKFLHKAASSILTLNMILIGSDFNVKVGQHERLHCFRSKINRKTKFLCDFMDQFNLKGLHARLQKQ